jgi:hypothetical protein
MKGAMVSPPMRDLDQRHHWSERIGAAGRTKVMACVIFIVAASPMAVGCSAGRSETVGREPVAITRTTDLKETVISGRDIAATPAGSAQRAFLKFWNALQLSAWPAAISYYDERLVTAIGIPRFVAALRPHSAYFQGNKPSGLSTVRIAGRVIVRFHINDLAGIPRVESISWRKTPEGWQINYHPQLDIILQVYAQTRVQNQIDPSSKLPAKRAVEAGARAARLQAESLADIER